MTFYYVDSKKCTMTIDDADNCGKQIEFFGDRDVFIPQNDAEVERHCK